MPSTPSPIARRLAGLAMTVLLLVATASCTGDEPPAPAPGTSTDAGTGTTPAPRYTWTPSPVPPRPESPAPLKQPVALSTAGTDLVVTLDTTAFDPVFDGPDRTFWMYVTIENVGNKAWRGSPGAGAVLTDELDGRFRPDTAPSSTERSSDAAAFGHDDTDLTRPVAVAPGDSVQGVLVFHVSGGPREVVLDLDLGDGMQAGFVTNFGLF